MWAEGNHSLKGAVEKERSDAAQTQRPGGDPERAARTLVLVARVASVSANRLNCLRTAAHSVGQPWEARNMTGLSSAHQTGSARVLPNPAPVRTTPRLSPMTRKDAGSSAAARTNATARRKPNASATTLLSQLGTERDAWAMHARVPDERMGPHSAAPAPPALRSSVTSPNEWRAPPSNDT